ncbi:dead domain containing protein [Grosmannia clavigera kw1407]|uniref:ATP-dependent DNA helicase CHL1 n=1 Tax=Grosmannia clavigera (strain kw1407 / UAMH 11150) TaxID=655863 RepID=F0XF48_GROCL|nr:dead domain containing protein [Grosmannia clavigera kw1407]EFX04078.1 dead domain containing protein [Grosmannia clavigera kw1407]
MTTADEPPAGRETIGSVSRAGKDDEAAAIMAAAKFHHPYTPYDVQMDFMRAVYDACATGGGQVAILESPTGTGKSLSLICGALTWLRQFRRSQQAAAVQGSTEAEAATATAGDEPDWVVEQMLRRRGDALRQRWERREARLAAARQREAKQAAEEERQQRMGGGAARKRRRVDVHNSGSGRMATTKKREDEEEDEFLLGESGGGDAAATGFDADDRLSWLSAETRAMMEKAGLVAGKRDEDDEDDEDGEDEVKIYYASRTHSQLTQFIAELRRPTFPSSLPDFSQPDKEIDGVAAAAVDEPIRHIPLSSRQRLCINPAVARLGSVGAINDRCAELQKPKKKTKTDDGKKIPGCPFAPSAENRVAERQFRDAALATLPDIEDLFRLGTELHVCPYYGSRRAAEAGGGAEIVTLPYPLLLHKAAREALGIRLENSVVIVDEAHNIMDAVAGVHAAALLAVYVRRFGRRLRGDGRVMVGQLGRVIQGLSAWMEGGADQINLFELVQYIQTSKLAFKVESYGAYVEEEAEKNQKVQKTENDAHNAHNPPVLHTLVSFLLALTNLSGEGRIFYERLPLVSPGAAPDVKLSYLLLSPTHAFSSIAASARAVILAGGTMAPFSDYRCHLFPSHAPERITTLSCGHVIPPSNLCVWTLAFISPSSPPLDFSFQKRSLAQTIRDLGAAMLNLCAVVPDGVVVFFPSYGYLDEVVAAWKTAGPGATSLWDRLCARKTVFLETRGAASSDDVLADYSRAILGEEPKSQGALLFSVVGGKMSEGINFADRLGRCVVIVGLPFPNPHAPDWKARMQYIEATARDANSNSSDSTSLSPAQQARDFYENACMRAVNQSIGRAIRHRADYAAIILADHRFATPRIRNKLPAWIRDGMVAASEDRGLSAMVTTLGGFFRGKKAEDAGT